MSGFFDLNLCQDLANRRKAYFLMNTESDLIKNLNKLHTTELGAVRIKRNLSLKTDCVVEWCREKIDSANAVIERKGKNWYVNVDHLILTVNANSYTIITAHPEKK